MLCPASQAYPDLRGRASLFTKLEDMGYVSKSIKKIPLVFSDFRNNFVLNLLISLHAYLKTLAFGILKPRVTEKGIKHIATCTSIFHLSR